MKTDTPSKTQLPQCNTKAKPKVVVFNYFINKKYNFILNITDWLASISHNYLVDCDKHFVVYTDNKEVAALVADGIDIEFVLVDEASTADIEENKRKKFFYIADWLEKQDLQFDYLAFIQSNSRCIKPVTLEELVGDGCDLVAFSHCHRLTFKQINGDNKGTSVDVSAIDTSKFIYVYAGHFIANKETLSRVCSFINSSIRKDNASGAYARWYDESYFNYYLNTVLLHDAQTKTRIMSGHVYVHSPYSYLRSGFKIDLLDKRKPYVSLAKAAPSSSQSLLHAPRCYYTYADPVTSSIMPMPRHNLGDFICTLALDNFLRLHGVKPLPLRRDLVSLFLFLPDDMLIMAGFFPGRGMDMDVNPSCKHVKYISFHYSTAHGSSEFSIPEGRYEGKIGCCDFGTYKLLSQSSPDCYISLCTSLMANLLDFSSILPKQDKTIFVDCSDNFVKRHIDLQSEEMTHQVLELGRGCQTMCEAALLQLKHYKEHAKKVYTPKVHCYLPCIALGIPACYIGPSSYRTEIVKIATPLTIKHLLPLVILNFEHELLGIGPDVHKELHSTICKLLEAS